MYSYQKSRHFVVKLFGVGSGYLVYIFSGDNVLSSVVNLNDETKIQHLHDLYPSISKADSIVSMFSVSSRRISASIGGNNVNNLDNVYIMYEKVWIVDKYLNFILLNFGQREREKERQRQR